VPLTWLAKRHCFTLVYFYFIFVYSWGVLSCRQWGGAGAGSAQEQLTAALNNPTADRGFVGSLSNLRTPHGLATIISGAKGLAINLQ
jgi:hypothetical protein